jgi:flagellar biosynthetic protein FliQ
MNGAEVLEVAREAIFVALKVGAPLLLIALVVGVAISLLQALTQIQEMTISFVPKILFMFLGSLLMLPFMASILETFSLQLFDRIVALH